MGDGDIVVVIILVILLLTVFAFLVFTPHYIDGVFTINTLSGHEFVTNHIEFSNNMVLFKDINGYRVELDNKELKKIERK